MDAPPHRPSNGDDAARRSPADGPPPAQGWARDASLAAALIVGAQVAGKAARDALFLGTFPVTSLPAMLVGAAVLSVLAALGAARLLQRLGPSRLIPSAFAAAAILQVLIWVLSLYARPLAAVLLYLQVAVVGALLLSGFWSLLSEVLDPRSARALIGRVAAGGTLGGLLGGLAAERVALGLGLPTVLLLLAGLHAVAALVTRRLARRLSGAQAVPARAGPRGEPVSLPLPDPTLAPVEVAQGWRALSLAPYLRDVALLAGLSAVAAGLLDYVLKANAVAAHQGHDLMRFFTVFYVLTGSLAFLMQVGLARGCLERLGLARTVATLPAGVTLGSLLAVAVPGLVSSALARGLEAALRSSLYRAGFELFFTPVPAAQKRAGKALIDVGADRTGDAVGGVLVKLVLLVLPTTALPALLGIAAALGLAAVTIALRLRAGYVRALEQNLLQRGLVIEPGETFDRTTRDTVMITLARLSGAVPALGAERRDTPAAAPVKTLVPFDTADRLTQEILILRGRDVAAVRALLEPPRSLAPALIPHVIPLLAQDELAGVAVRALRASARRNCGQLVDALLDERTEFVVRRRIPRALVAAPMVRAVDGLAEGLADSRFEVRFQCARALVRLRDDGVAVEAHRGRIMAAVLREAGLGRALWQGQQLLDPLEEDGAAPGAGIASVVPAAATAGPSLPHAFTLLSLIYPPQPIWIAFKGYNSSDTLLRGTALEYLDAILDEALKAALWPLLLPAPARGAVGGSEQGRRGGGPRPADQVLAELMRSSAVLPTPSEGADPTSRGS